MRASFGGKWDTATVLADAFGNALGNSIVDASTARAAEAATVDRLAKRGFKGAFDPSGYGNSAVDNLRLEDLNGPPLSNNPTNAMISPSFNLTPDQQRNGSSNAPDPVAVMDLQRAIAQEERERATSVGSSWMDESEGWTDPNALHIIITRGANDLPGSAIEANTNASALGITDAAVDADIAAGKTSGWDAAGYAARTTGYEVWNFLTAGFVKRQDARLTAEANGQLSSDNFWRATALDAVGTVGSLYAGGRIGGLALNRLGSGYAGYMGSGAAGAGVFDIAHQGTQLGINAITEGQTGQEQFSFEELALTTGAGAALGGGMKLLSDLPFMSNPLQSPLYVDLEPGAVYSGLPIGLRSPFDPTAPIEYSGGGFSIVDFSGYPDIPGVPRPTSPARMLQGDEYIAARAQANAANSALRSANPELYAGKQIHEVLPVKFGGDPVSIGNKVPLSPSDHYRLNAYFMRLQRYLEGK